jgi:crossover junction endodeoxyribonuclease RuvC
MTLLGIDPGYDRMGWSVITQDGPRTALVASGCIQTSREQTQYERYVQLHTELTEILKKYAPVECGLENLFFQNNAKTAMKVSEARGVIITTLLLNNVKVFDYTPLQIKSALTGNGKASKLEVQKMVALLTKSEKLPKLDDEVDAIATALCHAACRPIRIASHL